MRDLIYSGEARNNLNHYGVKNDNLVMSAQVASDLKRYLCVLEQLFRIISLFVQLNLLL